MKSQKQQIHQPLNQPSKISQQKSSQIHQHSQQQQQLPQHFYDSDIASVCQKDFLSDHQPPKDIVQERKLLYKQKFLHVFKTIIRVGQGIDKPARYDMIQLRDRVVPEEEIVKKVNKKEVKETKEFDKEQNKQERQQNEKKSKDQEGQNNQTNQNEHQQSYPPYYSTDYLTQTQIQKYNLGTKKQQIQRLVTSMKRGQTALFQLQFLQTSKKSNIKVKIKTQVHLIQVIDWVTVIDLQGDMRLLKQVIRKGEGAFRINFYDEANFQYSIKIDNLLIKSVKYDQNTDGIRFEKEFVENQLGKVIWRVLTSMKDQEVVRLNVKRGDFEGYQHEGIYRGLIERYKQLNDGKQIAENANFDIMITVNSFTKIDDIYLDGRLLKKIYIKGVSTAKPQSSSLIYYALRFIDDHKLTIKQDACFDSDWWQDFEKLSELQEIRMNYLDDYQISKMLKASIKRMKPGQIAEIECRDNGLFRFGRDFEEMKELIKFDNEIIPQKIRLVVRVYNFTQGKNAFNMQIQEKIIESRRKKVIATKLLQENRIKKALKRFQNIVAFYSSEKINQQAYDEKISALMNSVLCHMKMKNYVQMITLCNEILLKPRHGHQIKDLTIQGPGNAKIEGNLTKSKQEQGEGELEEGCEDTRRIAKDLIQNQKIIDKCLYRKAWALVQMGECEQALQSMNEISNSNNQTQQVMNLKEQAFKGQQKYQTKSKKMFKNMFS